MNTIRFKQLLQDSEGKTFEIYRREAKRSSTQNAYYWHYLEVIEAETGNIADDMHEYFRRKLLPPKFIHVNGETVKIPSSTTELTKVEFGEYLDKICALTNVPLPRPEEAGYITNY
jgi:hypothetical protein